MARGRPGPRTPGSRRRPPPPARSPHRPARGTHGRPRPPNRGDFLPPPFGATSPGGRGPEGEAVEVSFCWSQTNEKCVSLQKS